MAIKVADGFEITTNIPVDKRFRFSTIAERDALSPLERYEGLVTYVEEGSLLCQLKGGITNDKWSPVGEGDVSGPSSTNDSRLVRWDGVTGKKLKNSGVILDDFDQMSGLESVTTTALNADLMRINESIDSSATGENAMIVANNSRVILTNASLVSISGISATTAGKVTTIVNKTGKNIRVIHNYSGFLLDNRFTLPDGKDIDLKPDASITVARSVSYGSHIVQGGSGSGDGSKTLETIFQLTADEPLSDWTFLNDDLSISKVDPLFGDASYELKMTNLAMATYKVIPVDIGFRGTTVALTLNYLMPQGAARVSLLDQDNEVIDGATFDIPAANGKEKFGTTVFIPSDVTGIRFKVESRDTVAGQVFKFDNIEISSDLLKSVDIEDKWQQLVATDISGIALNLSTGTKEGNSSLFSVSGNSLTTLANVELSISAYARGVATAASGYIGLNVSKGSSILIQDEAVSHASSYGVKASVGEKLMLPQGSTLTLNIASGAASTLAHGYTILAKARTKSIVAPTDQVTERSIAWRWRSPAQATEANLSATGKIGDYVTGQYAANTNTLTQCTTRPDQTDDDMRINGPRIYTRAYDAPSTAALPARIVVKIAEPKQLDACDITLFKNTSRDITISLDYWESAGVKFGASAAHFNPATGLLTLDLGRNQVSTNSATLVDSAGFNVGSGYLTFTASKLAQAVAIPTRKPYFWATNSTGGVVPSSSVILVEGWTTKNISGFTFDGKTLTVMEDGVYSLSAQVSYSGNGNLSDNVQTRIVTTSDSFIAHGVRESTASPAGAVCSVVGVPLRKGDTVEVYCYFEGASIFLDVYRCWFQATKTGDL